jgi:dTDP-4-amino-4,6-dideoxygalactose transaminase
MNKDLIQKPLLAKSNRLLHYLKKIDNNRYYTNFGPLYEECKKKFEKYLGLIKNTIIFTSNGHSSLLSLCCLVKKENPKKKYILVPSFSFHANPQAILQSGFEPIFMDIKIQDLCMDCEQIDKAFKKYKKNIAAIMFVSPFGYPISINYLNDIQDRFNTTVIYDAADTFPNFDKKTIDQSKILIACSFHPLKTLPANESGMIITPRKYSNYFNSVINFGLINNKNKKTINLGFNAKFSEYDAAILMANLENVKNIKKKIIKNIRYIIHRLESNKFIKLQHLFGKTWISLKFLIITNKIINFKSLYSRFLSKYKIQIYKPWSDLPMHKHNFFIKFKKLSLENTNFIERRIFCLPFSIDFSKKELDRLINLINNNFYE